jgi:hypothetical protein
MASFIAGAHERQNNAPPMKFSMSRTAGARQRAHGAVDGGVIVMGDDLRHRCDVKIFPR